MTRIVKKISQIIFSTLFFASLFSPSIILAQSSAIPLESVGLNLVPETPEPGSTVRASVSNFLIDLNSSTISWYLNGALLGSGIAKKEIQFSAGASGTTSVLKVVIRASDGRSVSKEVTLRPSSVDLVYEAVDSYTPPFYKGKALPGYEGMVKVVAVSNIVSGGVELPSSSLVYTWRRDGTVLGSLSGVDKKQIVFRLPKLSDSSTVEVEVTNLAKTIRAVKKITVSSGNTKALVYENNPLFGVLFNKLLSGEFSLQDKEVIISSYPLFFSAASVSDPRINYNWKINGKSSGGASSLVLRAPEESGTSNISLTLGNDRQVLQSASRTFKINFGTGSASNPFF